MCRICTQTKGETVNCGLSSQEQSSRWSTKESPKQCLQATPPHSRTREWHAAAEGNNFEEQRMQQVKLCHAILEAGIPDQDRNASNASRSPGRSLLAMQTPQQDANHERKKSDRQTWESGRQTANATNGTPKQEDFIVCQSPAR